MRLKQIKLAGFKSFVDATTVPFPAQMTAIVGPNGCGKSNVIDAVRWVLGESSAKNLRGDSMTDVIFNGSSSRKPVSVASVELVFDNAEGRLQGSMADRTEISVKRQVTKDAQSSYFLNGSKCRRRDITDIFLGTGLGPRSYAIIEQGMISRLIESKPQELRIFIEEAAGISKYKERRRETENRIKHTRDNLERLEDVIEELSTQLEKLKRQAATARRYKELKAKERTLKAELYALKWHKYNEQLNVHEKDRLLKEAELESFIAQQRGGELGILQLKEQQQGLSDKVQDCQQKSFQISNQITKVEQQILFANETKSRQHEDASQLQETIAEAKEHLEFEQAKLLELEEEIEALSPEQEILDEQHEISSEQLLEAELAFEQWQNQWQNEQKTAANAQQSSQVVQTKLQSLEVQISRMQQRIFDLSRETSDLSDEQMVRQIENLQQEQVKLNEQHQLLSIDVKETETKLKTATELLNLQEQEVQSLTTQYQIIQSNIKNLQDMQADYERQVQANVLETAQQFDVLGSVLSQLKVDEEWQHAVEVLLTHMGQPVLLSELPSEQINGQFVCATEVEAKVGSIAEKIQSGYFPSWFNHVAIQTNENTTAKLDESSWIGSLNQQGEWLGSNWQSVGGVNSSEVGTVFKRIQQLEQLKTEQSVFEVKLADSEQKLATIKLEREACENRNKQVVNEFSQINQAKQENELSLKLLLQQHEQNQLLVKKLQVESESLQEQIELEQEQVYVLQEELELVNEESLQFESRLIELEEQKETLAAQLTSAKQQVEEFKNRRHQLALKSQSVNAQFESVQQNVKRGEHHISTLEQKLSNVQSQLSTGEDPTVELQAQLEQLLEDKLVIEGEFSELNIELAEVSERLKELEQGQSGVLSKMDKMRNEIASIKLDSEGARVRAQNMLETINELDVPLKSILESMPGEAEENEWAERLEKTSNSINRLGAINLTAIEEYDIQSERKGYLDEQYHDLTSALDTLESAIRKIDRESRAKFKQTYEQVNADLQHLFPKVFGGGAAYLELTADDLLETGVTIMARPPGKKNSTIHLLSGGEKALTALSLVFSIFRLNPAPFCMLDEVDAPLDDANVGRFCNLVKEMSSTVQFIYISHNKVAMEMATHLTGVTMQEPGVSRLVAVDIQEAVNMAEAS